MQWVQVQEDKFEEGAITVLQDFMNLVSVKYNKIASSGTSFHGSSKMITEDVIAMVSSLMGKHNVAGSTSPSDATTPSTTASCKVSKLCPFAKHFKTSNSPGASAYKVSDSKEWDGCMWYFCDCPNHKDCLKWHTHTAESCHSHQCWLGSKLTNSVAVVTPEDATVATMEDTTLSLLTDPFATTPTHVSALLASILSLASGSGNTNAQDLVADTLDAIHYA